MRPLIRLIGIDVDGTLVGASGEVNPAIWAAAEQARAAGIHLALCSGRPAFGTALEYARRLDPTGWHIFQNGASIVHLGTGESRSTALPAEIVANCVRIARSTDDVLELYNDRRFVTESTHVWAVEHAKLLGVPFEAQPFDSLDPPIVRAQWLLSPERAREVMSALHDRYEIAQSTSPLMPDVRFVGLTPKGVNKGSAIHAVATTYGVDLDDVMYVGDAGNDLPALRLVGHPIAMGNADPAVLEAAVCTVGHVDHGGLAQAISFALTGDVPANTSV
jgi:Cof subfamily protein (haloacid dehalogenase superfamily)